jgi:predicted membrane protein
MNAISIYLTQILMTTFGLFLLLAYLRPHLKRVLVDLCGSEQRAQFWTVFSNIVLMAVPILFGLGFHPEATGAQNIFFEIVNQIKLNLLGFVLGLLGAGFVVMLFALVAPRTQN